MVQYFFSECLPMYIPVDFGSFVLQCDALTPLQQAITLRIVWAIGQSMGPKTKGTPMVVRWQLCISILWQVTTFNNFLHSNGHPLRINAA